MMNPKIYDGASTVEQYELTRGKRKPIYPPTEKINVIEVENFPLLGKFTALRFVEWVLKNPDGVISLPTGKTPEHFIKWVQHILAKWDTPEVRRVLETYGIDASRKPDMKSLSFVQIDEFYPMDARQHNSFHHYVNEFYIKAFGLTPEKALLIDATSLGLPPGKTMREVFPNNIVDLSLRVRQLATDLERLQKDVINRVDEFCMAYETKIHEMGGIGFFLGGIGPDGHIAFNIRGSSVYSVTRLTGTNYETQAAAATDLGGMEISRNRLVITIGLATITYNPSCTAIIIAAGDAKSNIVAQAIQHEKSPQYPASVLQDLKHARFYLTRGAASNLVERQLEEFKTLPQLTESESDRIVVSLALSRKKSLDEMSNEDFKNDRFATELVRTTGSTCRAITDTARKRMIQKIERGLQYVKDTVFLHTEPHHDDIMLGYLAHLYHLVRDASNVHYFANLTSGFTSVTNAYVLSILRKLELLFDHNELTSLLASGYFDPKNVTHRMADVYLYLDGIAGTNVEKQDRAEAYRLLRNLIDVYRTNDLSELRTRINRLHEYLNTQYPGAKDPEDVQTLKGTFREWEVELLWAYFGIEASSIRPLRLGFYTGDIFSQEPEVDRDLLPIYEYINEIKPNIVTVAFDPEGSGPDTHYKALQAVAGALKMYQEKHGAADIRVWGYRNVWYRFTPAETNLMVPVSLNSLTMLHTAFMNCFGSQRAASFPSYDHDGPFSELAQKIQVEQYQQVKTCLGNDFFLKHTHPRLRAARGMIYLKEMNLEEFFLKVRELKKTMEVE
jgi:glucosamine-6-phosphate deaminase